MIAKSVSDKEINHLVSFTALKNRYFVQRHGESTTNVEVLIRSDPALSGTDEYPLTAMGVHQAEKSAQQALSSGKLGASAIIVSSGFKRTRQTAEITREVLGAPSVTVSDHLRERYFGKWDGTPVKDYHIVWTEDKIAALDPSSGVETVGQVLDRTTALVASLETKYSGQNILLVSHGDTSTILQTAFEKIPAEQHPELPHLGLGEIRELVYK